MGRMHATLLILVLVFVGCRQSNDSAEREVELGRMRVGNLDVVLLSGDATLQIGRTRRPSNFGQSRTAG